ncbi:MAG: zinc-binding dehydrogenase [Chitinophagaceae bacterium]|nr:zinc-binding dehydrogenase [Chitinophagaceae bacterium]
MANSITQVIFEQFGGPEVLKVVGLQAEPLQPGEVRIAAQAIGVNFSDTLRRRNRYFQPTPLPFCPGAEVAGIITEVGEEVMPPFVPGLMVLALMPYGGGYSSEVRVPAQFCIPLPQGMDAQAAAGVFVQGSAAQLMVSSQGNSLADKTVLINAAAGGVGLLLVQLARRMGARVLAAAGSAAKLQLAAQHGAHACFNYTLPKWADAVKNATDGKGADIAFETVGGEVYNQTLAALATGGTIMVYGCASGVQGNIHPEHFVDESITQSGFNLAWYISNKPDIWQQALGKVIEWVAAGELVVHTAHRFALKDAAEAHRQIEARQTTGKVILIPS